MTNDNDNKPHPNFMHDVGVLPIENADALGFLVIDADDDVHVFAINRLLAEMMIDKLEVFIGRSHNQCDGS